MTGEQDMKRLKYIFCDLDGTLLTDDKQIASSQLTYLKKLKAEKQIRIGIATGRAWTAVLPLVETYNLFEVVDAFVFNNGVDLYDTKAKAFRQNEMVETEQIDKILQSFSPYEFVTVSFHNPKGLFTTGRDWRTERILKNNRLSKVHSPWEETYEPAARVMLLFEPEDRKRVEELLKKYPVEGVKYAFSEVDLCEMFRAEVSKANGIHSYVAQYGDDLKDVLVFGNSDNDLEMIEGCGLSVAVKNSTELILNKADHVSPCTNNDDGVIAFLKEHTFLF